jgi:hypothetical protein
MRVIECSSCYVGDITLCPEVLCPEFGRRKHHWTECPFDIDFGLENIQSPFEEVTVLFFGVTDPRTVGVFTLHQF